MFKAESKFNCFALVVTNNQDLACQFLWKSPSRDQAVIASPVGTQPIVPGFTFNELDRCRIQI